MDEQLKPCPFCGGNAFLSIGGEHFTIPECSQCGARLPAFFGKDKDTKAIAAWNRRHEPSAEWLLHEDTDVWECTACHTCFELDKGVPADKLITYCPVCETQLYMPE